MWNVDTLWFEVAVVMSIFAVGNIVFGHFEQHKPTWQRLLKVGVVLALVVGVSTIFGRGWAFGLLGAMLLIPLVIHAWWLPKHGVSGWTGEPKERFHELMGHKKGGPAEGAA